MWRVAVTPIACTWSRSVVLGASFSASRWATRRERYSVSMPEEPRPSSRLRRREVLGQVLVHLEHRDLLLAEHRLQRVVRQDLAPVFRVLQVMLLDVVPDLADDLAARQGVGPDHGGQFFRRLQGLLKRIGLLASRACRRFCFAAFFLRYRGGFGGLGFFSCFGFFRCLGRHACPPSCWVRCLSRPRSADHK